MSLQKERQQNIKEENIKNMIYRNLLQNKDILKAEKDV